MIATSRTPKTWPRPQARWFRDHVRTRPVDGISTSVDGRRSNAVWAGLGLATLVVLTTVAVAWVSIWWVPAYLALMALIFVTPQASRRPALAREPGVASADPVTTHLANNLRIVSAAEGELIHLAVAETSGPSVGELATEEADDVEHDIASSTVAKPRRSRGRARKVVKTTAAPLPESAPATWIRVGPGKFVRADTYVHALDKTHSEDPLTDLRAVTGVSAEGIPALTAPAVLEQEQLSLEPLEQTRDDEGIAIASADLVRRPVTEEYGITPSTFSPIPQGSTSVDGLGHDAVGAAVEPKADPVPLADLDVQASWRTTDPSSPGSQGRAVRSYVGRVSRRIASAIRDEDRVSSRRIVRNDPRPRTFGRSSFVPNTCFHQAARRAFGRISHIHRALRPRSPPHR